MPKKLKELLFVAAVSIIPTLLIWLPFFLRIRSFWSIPLPQNGMATIVANYDGPLFMVVAKSFYASSIISHFQFVLPYEYYAAHFPLFPLLIRLFSYVLGYPYAMLAVTLISSFLATYFFYLLAKEKLNGQGALFLTLVFSLLPARWLIVKSVGSAEPLFIMAIIASLFYFDKKKFWLAALFGIMAQLTKSPGILLFIAYFAYLFVPKLKYFFSTSFPNWFKSLSLEKIYPIFLIPLSLIGLFCLYKLQYNDFFAYFHSGDNLHLFFPPFKIFNYSAPWVGTFWLEEVIFVYLFGILGLINLIKRGEKAMAYFVGIFFASTLLVAHRDIIRYSLPIFPFLLLAFSDTICKKEFRIVILVLALPIYLFSLAYISQNVMPIADWSPFFN
jgi:hypothetical protein